MWHKARNCSLQIQNPSSLRSFRTAPVRAYFTRFNIYFGRRYLFGDRQAYPENPKTWVVSLPPGNPNADGTAFLSQQKELNNLRSALVGLCPAPCRARQVSPLEQWWVDTPSILYPTPRLFLFFSSSTLAIYPLSDVFYAMETKWFHPTRRLLGFAWVFLSPGCSVIIPRSFAVNLSPHEKTLPTTDAIHSWYAFLHSSCNSKY